jgi:large subunit ribosomal protein L22
MQVKAKLKYLRMSPKKVRLVINLIRGLKVEEAIIQLGFVNKIAKRPVIKLIKSAISNAENNFNLKRDNLLIKEIRVDEAGFLDRWQPKAHGRATPIRKKFSHVILVLDEIVPTKVKAKKIKKGEKTVKISSVEKLKEKPIQKVEAQKEKIQPNGHDKEIGKEIIDVRLEGKHRHNQNMDKKMEKGAKGHIKKFFNRKSG